jgi:CBS domain containing-hemolysin-like protein
VTPWLLLGVAVLLIAGNALFVAAETSLVTVERTEVEAAAARATPARPAARRAGPAVHPAVRGAAGHHRHLAGDRAGRRAVDRHPAARPAEAVGLPEGAVEPVAVAVGLLLASVVQMVLGELVPKNLALARPFPTATAVLGPQLAFAAAHPPAGRVLNGTANRLLRAVGVEPTEELRSARTPDELSLVLRQSAARGSLAPGPRCCWSGR